MLTAGQLSTLKSGLKLDGSPASRELVRNVTRNVKVKVYETAADLRTLYELNPEMKKLVAETLRWLLEAEGTQVPAKKQKVHEAPAVSKLPDVDMDSLENYEPDPVSAFKGLV